MSMSTAPRDSLISRLLRGAAITTGGFVVAQVLRFGSNLILARLLFPEAFGLMALMAMILMGLTLLSDTGVQQSVMQHKRGDDRDFLNTAFTLNAARGIALWCLACLLAWPAARIYDAPELLQVLPVGALGLILAGLSPTRIYTAQRHLLLGRIMVIDLLSQITGIALMVALAWSTGSVWSLVWGGLAAAIVKLLLEWTTLPGPGNQIRWEPEAAGALLRFGGWIMLSSAFGFILAQGDRAILGVFLSIEGLGIYNIAWFLASFPILLGNALVGRLLIPAYRGIMDAADPQLDARIRKLRYMLTSAIWIMLVLLALMGPWIVDFLYDARYALAGPMVVMIASVSLIPLVTLTYDQAALARGASKRFFQLVAIRAGLLTICFLGGVFLAGLPGALAGQALAALLAYPFVARMAREMNVWDPRHDAIFLILGLGTLLALTALHWHRILPLAVPI
ncbi:MAG: oligosaccharide flippase family protein [Roseinatronobacter sp.]